MLQGLVGGKELTEAEQAHIHDLQSEIDEIWNRRGDYKIDDDAWKTMPLFMEHITEQDVLTNENCAALASIVYDDVPPEEIAGNRKDQGNKAIALALNPDQVNKENLARAAAHCYTEGLVALCNDKVLNSQLYANRSLAHFIMKNFGHGLQDGQKAILLNPDYSKAYYRAAKCAEKIRKYDIALNLLDKAQRTNPPPTGQPLDEILALEKICVEGRDAQNLKQKRDSQKVRADAAESSNIMRAITSAGVKISQIPEVTSDQINQYGRHKPYFDTNGMLHVPLLFMYDEYQQTDYMQDVSCDVSVIELLDEVMPFPWDDRGRYAKFDDIVTIFKIDDGVKMPEYYEMDQSWPLLEVFRCAAYQMPLMLPVIHVVAKDSELLARWGVKKCV